MDENGSSGESGVYSVSGLEFEDDYELSPTAAAESVIITSSAAKSTIYIPPTSQSITRRLYDVLSLDQVLNTAKPIVTETCDILGVDADVAEFLLHNYRWKNANLAEDWMDSPEKVLAKAGLSSAESSAVAAATPRSKKKKFQCFVCYEEVAFTDADALSCTHRVCNGCWRNYLETAVAEEGPEACITKKCIMFKCGVLIPLVFWRTYLCPESFDKYLQFRKRAAVDTDPTMRWCPKSNCGLVIKHHYSDSCDSSGMADVSCNCGEKFCFLCGDVPHSPVTCAIALKWNEKNKSEADNVTWILANTKNCPSCKQPIEKNQGCMHMTCRCRYEFCWLCMADWTKHAGDAYRCNVYETGTSAKRPEEEQRQRAKEALERYAHFFERYRAHSHGERVAKDTQLVDVKTLNIGLHKMFPLIMDSDFLENAVRQIIECRRFLKWSYAFAYFATWKNNTHSKVLFEDHQGELEKNLDRLQEVTEHFTLEQFSPHQSQEFLEFKTKLVDLTRVIHSWFQKMSDALVNDFISQYG